VAKLGEVPLRKIACETECCRQVGLDLDGCEVQQTCSLTVIECTLNSRSRCGRQGSRALIRAHFDPQPMLRSNVKLGRHVAAMFISCRRRIE
jgi:hypothetical protein